MAEESVSEQEVQESRIALEMATKSLVALDQAAHGYAKLPAAVKPSWDHSRVDLFIGLRLQVISAV
mgnify:CR=1 FL=1